MLAEQLDPRLRTYVVWVPKKGGLEKDVPVATRVVPDGRASHFWDGSGKLMRAYAEVLGLGQDAWDVFFLYGPEAHWDGDLPPPPRFWMHQLRTAKGTAYDARVFADSVNRMLGHP